jgi:hypothetical protein
MAKEIFMINGKAVLVNDEDFEWLSKFRWRPDKDGYARTTYRENGKRVDRFMHRMIMDAPKGTLVDHINGNKIDNTRENLRFCTYQQNQWNQRIKEGASSVFKGVGRKKGSDSFEARIKIDGKLKYIGMFSSEFAAANAYNYYAKMYFGEFAHINDVEYMENWNDHRVVHGSHGTSKYRGVCWSSSRKKWRAGIKIKGKSLSIGEYDTEDEAAIAYNNKAYELLGEKATLNIVEGVV